MIDRMPEWFWHFRKPKLRCEAPGCKTRTAITFETEGQPDMGFCLAHAAQTMVAMATLIGRIERVIEQVPTGEAGSTDHRPRGYLPLPLDPNRYPGA